jgi:hypothetical protein
MKSNGSFLSRLAKKCENLNVSNLYGVFSTAHYYKFYYLSLTKAMLLLLTTEAIAPCFHRMAKYCRGKLRHPERLRCVCGPRVLEKRGKNMKPRPYRLIVANYELISVELGGVMMARLESSFGMENGLVEQRPEDHTSVGLS